MKKILMLLVISVMTSGMALAARSYDIVGLYHESLTTIPAKDRVITQDEQIAQVSMVLIPASIREKTYNVTATRVAKNVYRIKCETLTRELYVEVRSCNKKGTKNAEMTITDVKGEIKGKLKFK